MGGLVPCTRWPDDFKYNVRLESEYLLRGAYSKIQDEISGGKLHDCDIQGKISNEKFTIEVDPTREIVNIG